MVKRFCKTAPTLLGAFFFALAGCQEKDQSGDWAGQKVPAPVEQPTKTAPPAPAPTVEPAAPVVAQEAEVAEGTVRFLSYNVQNWLTMEREVNGRREPGRPKPDAEKQAVAALIAAEKPDIVGVSEIGTEEDVKDLQAKLEQAGYPLEHFHLNQGSDPTRRLVLLSKFPITKAVTREDLTYRSNGKEYAMQRGILDATVETPVGAYRFLGVHFKSKREITDGDQEDMRRNEAHLLRREINAIIEQEPEARLVVYGDFNDTRNSPTLRTARGTANTPSGLVLIALKDSRGQFWTHHWSYQDVYSRIDYVMVSQALRRSVLWDDSKVIDSEGVEAASDHRPLLVVLK